MAKDNRAKIKLDRRKKVKSKRILIKIPPLPNGGTMELVQGPELASDDILYAPPGTTATRLK